MSSESDEGWYRPTLAEQHRALRRASRAAPLSLAEVRALLACGGDELDQLMSLARERRGRHWQVVGSAGQITYSPKVFIPLTRLCQDRCHYCTFAAAPAQLRAAGQSPYLNLEQVVDIARAGAAQGCTEALFTLGDAPEKRWPQARQWLAEAGYSSTLEYLRAAAITVLETTGLLPHLNPGLLNWQDMQMLRPVAASMGLMLETSARRLFTTPREVHYGSPDKDPKLRLQTLRYAGMHNVPLTSGILVGIGENLTERAQSLLDLAAIDREFGQLQEVIVQNFRAKPETAAAQRDDAAITEFLAAIAVARLVLPTHVHVQAPPNLSATSELTQLLSAGIDDWGGISPVTIDHVNPEAPWPEREVLAQVGSEAGFTLSARLPIYPEYVADSNRWLDPRIHPHVFALAAPDGLAKTRAQPAGLPWQEADSYESFRKHLDSAQPARPARVSPPVGAVGVWGDWQEAAAAHQHSQHAAGAPWVGVFGEFAQGMRLAEQNPAKLADAHHEKVATALMSARGDELVQLAKLADQLRFEVVGDPVSYVNNRNINFTNVCYTGCRFCAFAKREDDLEAQTLSLAEVGNRVDEAVHLGATEICMQGGIHPRLPAQAYFDLITEVRKRQVHLHAFSPMEIVNAANRAHLSVPDWLAEAKRLGLGSIPGTAAEILDDEIRWILTKGKLPTSQWVETVSTAHQLGIPSTATMMYGHVDAPVHWVRHIRLIRELQLQTGGFTEFVPLPFVHHNSPIYLAGIARPGPSAADDVAVTAMARILLHAAIDNVQVSWVKVGPTRAAELLRSGANDLGGTLMEENISRMAGSQHGQRASVSELAAIAAAANRPLRQRDTLYKPLVEPEIPHQSFAQ